MLVEALDVEEDFEDELSLLDCTPVLPIKVLEPSEEETVFAGYVCGPIEGELDDLVLDPPELPEDAEELPHGSVSVEVSVCEPCGISSVEE